MSEEVKKKIEDYIKEAYVGLTDDQQAPFTVGDLKAETRDDIEFGYQLGKNQVKAALRREIEKRIEFYNAMAKAAETKSEYIEALRIIDGLGITIELLDTVE